MSKTLILLFIPLSIFGQDILLDEKKKEGLYSNFIEFRTNSPSIEGEIEFVTNKRGKVINFLINGDSIRKIDFVKNYWGFFKDSLVYVNTFKEWPKTEQNKIPNEAYYPLNLGFYSYCIVETSNTNAALIGGVAGGIVGGLIAAGVSTSLGHKEILTIHHKTGAMKIAKKSNTQFLLMDEIDLMNDFENAKNQEKDISRIMSFLDKYNTRKKNKKEIVFDEKEMWPTIIVARKTKKQSLNQIDFYVNDVLIDSIDQKDFFKGKVPYSKEMNLEFKIGQSIISETIKLEIEPNERRYFIISNSLKSPNEIEVKTSDASRTGYIIKELN